MFRQILALKERIERETLPRFSHRRQDNVQALMRHLYARPIVDVDMARRWIGVTTNTAAALITDLTAQGILTEVTGRRRNRLFAFREYLDLFR
ncbi:helix-turn-helix domain-containing protein [Sphingomonas sp. CCH9-E2]|uniref:helix-turn-helix domain-containing protein n=1 Tax=Sphingomonas sp. CCH9-E2 TaxID=1768776 RepID=UPI000835F8FB|nr:helix-turn-helix domain-containing protein [Sphingomonas sp. CCH9-E2]